MTQTSLNPQILPRWSPLPMAIASGLYGLLLILILDAADTKFRPILMDFKVEPVWQTRVAMTLSRIVCHDYGWVILIPLMFAWPFAILPYLPVPQKQKTRRAVVITSSFVTVIVFLIGYLLVANVFFTSLIDLIQSDLGPQKN